MEIEVAGAEPILIVCEWDRAAMDSTARMS